MELTEKENRFLKVMLILMVIGVLGIIWSLNGLNKFACNPPERLGNYTYPIHADVGFFRINIGCNKIGVGEGNFGYYGINGWLIGGVIVGGIVITYFVLRDSAKGKEK